MNPVKHYTFFKTKYGNELLVDIVQLTDIRKYLEEYPNHSLAYYDITFITEGEGTFRIDDQEYIAGAGEVVFSMPRQVRYWDKDRIMDGYALIFEEEFLCSFFNDTSFLQHLAYFKSTHTIKKLSLNKQEYARMVDLLLDIKQEIDDYEQKDHHLLRALLYQILVLLNRMYANQHLIKDTPPQINRYVNKFMELVEVEFIHQHSIQFYAEKLCITPNHLNELVRLTTGSTAKQLIQHRIILEAKRMLLYGTLSVSEIATQLNYETTSYFIRFFRNQTGATPLGYRNSKP